MSDDDDTLRARVLARYGRPSVAILPMGLGIKMIEPSHSGRALSVFEDIRQDMNRLFLDEHIRWVSRQPVPYFSIDQEVPVLPMGPGFVVAIGLMFPGFLPGMYRGLSGVALHALDGTVPEWLLD